MSLSANSVPGLTALTALTAPARANLGHVLDHLGTTLLEVAAGDPTLPVAEEGVGGVVIHDPIDVPVLPPRALVLGVGVHEPDDVLALLTQTAGAGGAGLVVRAPAPVDQRITAVAERTGTVLLALTRGASWHQLATLVRSLLGEGRVGAAEPESLGGVPAGDLFALANAIAALIDAPVTIEDRSSRILAFSGRQDEADESRIQTILGRQVPDRFTRGLEAQGVFRRLYGSDRPVWLSPDVLSMPEVTVSRVAIAVRAGDEILGTIWAAVDAPLSPACEQSLVDSAKLVALHLLRMRAGADVERRLASELVATALEGGPGTVDALRRLGLAGRPLLVLAMGLTEDRDGAGTLTLARREADRQRSADALAVHLSALHPGSVVAVVGGVCYAVLPVSADAATADERAAAVATEFLQRTGGRVAGMIGVGTVAPDVSALVRSRDSADRALRVLRSGTSSRRVARAADVHVESLMLQLADLAAAEGHRTAGPVARLAAYDEAHRTQLVETLRAWLDAHGDAIAAAAQVHVHPNTFRYRLRRIRELGGIDLDDADSRFAAMVELRLPHR
ncbi:PucR family transcriptional regulator [Blastococcus xanthinilyticus]|uniref:PucR family transcriptional regulator n=1 Tax=Blastococcus xanthinilyticus TaxID=1564164 RepID=UPI001AA1810B|nr:PucR family transcriptional regulator [Blastococcus xanthinilyticus]